ncbi:Hsp33 family molecular chaperone HslO [Salinicoccus sp. ID82-1]|uniref:33 kDa chaperonin n=2 Tax=Staphylococcaceae TaxID=90964 RepID=A0A558AS80_9STAP|nr:MULTISPECIES: Hsp33 family molecular chaperone HslO [Salinicoccus]MCG1009505.1 Hsp33 family molecular chaperone HslO [Salinicoccus sp. ID82-1]TVT27123.1 Hsp33 family molecular chaperone HslO [Salinicoccus cyprini]
MIRGIGMNDEIRIFSVDTTDTVNEAVRRHGAYPTAAAALGRSMTAGLMMGAMLKNEEKVTITIQGGGPIGAIVVDSDAKGNVRGYLSNPHVHFPLNDIGKLDVRRAVGTDGFLNVAKDIGLKEHFTGSTEIVSGELGEDFSYYFYASEQVPSIVALGVLVNPDNSIKAAGGFIIQVLPGASDETVEFLDRRAKEMTPVSKLIDQGLTPEEIINEAIGEENWRSLDEMPVQFECSCSKDRFLNAIASLDPSEIISMIQEDGGAEADCHFCRNKVWIEKEELQELITH